MKNHAILISLFIVNNLNIDHKEDDMIRKPVAKMRKPGQVRKPGAGRGAKAGGGSFQSKSFHKGEVIFKEGHKAYVAYLIKKGVVQIYKVIDNQRQVLANLESGQIFGEMGVINHEPRMASAMALEFCELVTIDENTINMCLKQSPPVINSLTKLLINRIRIQAAKLYEQEKQGIDVFMTTCIMLDMMGKLSGGTVDHGQLCNKIKEITPASELDVDNVVLQLYKINLLGVEKAKNRISSVTIKDPESFMKTAKGFYDNWNQDDEPKELEFLDIMDLAEKVNVDPSMVYKKIAGEEVPQNLFFFHQKAITQWINEVGVSFFQTVKKKRKNVEDFDSVNDVVYLDKDTLGKACQEIGINGVGMILSKAEEEAKKRIMGTLGKKMRDVIEEEFPEDREIDEIEADEVEEEFIKKIKIFKGVLKEEGEEGGEGGEGGDG